MNLRTFVLVVCLLAACSAPPTESNVTAIVGATLIDGADSPPIIDALVLVADGKIIAAGRRAEVEIPTGANTIDATGKTVIPGLIDLHSHYAIFAPNPATAKRQLAAQLAFGVTTIRSIGLDAAETLAAMAEVKSGKAPGPRTYTAGLGFTHPGGAPTQFASELGYVRQPETADQAREGVRELAVQEADFLKIWVDSVQGTVPKISREVTEAIVDEAREHGIPVVAHVTAREDLEYLLGLGVTDFLHTLIDQDPMDQSFIEAVRRDDVSFTPTMAGIEASWLFAENPALVESDPELQAVLGAEQVAQIADPAWREERLAAGVDDRKAALERAQRFVAQMHGEGVTILVGSDCPVTPHGWGTHNELRLLVEAGLDPLEAIRAATGRAARRLGSTDFGTIRAGAAADLIVLDGDPLVDITNTRKISRVMQGGRWVDREALLTP